MWFREGLNAKTNICVKIQKHIKLRKYLSFFQAGVVMSVCVYMNTQKMRIPGGPVVEEEGGWRD